MTAMSLEARLESKTDYLFYLNIQIMYLIVKNLFFIINNNRGRYATVKKCYCKNSRQVYAAKIIKNYRTKNTKLNMNIVDNEITALTLARSHSSIVNLYEVFQHKGETILVLE
jgi:hypothetical protein